MTRHYAVIGLLFSATLACYACTTAKQPAGAAATTPVAPAAAPTATPVLLRVLLDVTGRGDLPQSRPFSLNSAAANVCWRIEATDEPRAAGVMVALHDLSGGEERARVSIGATPSGCQMVALPAAGGRYTVTIVAPPAITWHVTVVGH